MVKPPFDIDALFPATLKPLTLVCCKRTPG